MPIKLILTQKLPLISSVLSKNGWKNGFFKAEESFRSLKLEKKSDGLIAYAC